MLKNFSADKLNKAKLGRITWIFLHSCFLNASENTFHFAKTLVVELRYMYPCLICQKHYREEVFPAMRSPEFENAEMARKWLHDLHVHISKRLGKVEKYEYPAAKKEMVKNFGDNFWSGLPSFEVLGKATWLLLHSISTVYSKSNQENVRAFIHAASQLYPFEQHRRMFSNLMLRTRKWPNDRDSFVAFINESHDICNFLLDKIPLFLTVEESRQKFHCIETEND